MGDHIQLGLFTAWLMAGAARVIRTEVIALRERSLAFRAREEFTTAVVRLERRI